MPLQELVMRMFDVQGIEIVATRAKVFEFLKEPGNLPQWAHAFVSAEEGRARLETPEIRRCPLRWAKLIA